MTLLNFGKRYEDNLKGHFWSVAKVALMFGCAKQSKNLEWYLVYILYIWEFKVSYLHSIWIIRTSNIVDMAEVASHITNGKIWFFYHLKKSKLFKYLSICFCLQHSGFFLAWLLLSSCSRKKTRVWETNTNTYSA